MQLRTLTKFDLRRKVRITGNSLAQVDLGYGCIIVKLLVQILIFHKYCIKHLFTYKTFVKHTKLYNFVNLLSLPPPLRKKIKI